MAQSFALHASERVNLLHWLSRIIVLHRIRNWSHGRLEIALSGKALIVLGPSGSSDVIRVTVHDDEFFTRVLIGGSTGAGEAYMDGQWSCSDLPGLIEGLLSSYDRIPVDSFLSWPRRLVDYLRHKLRPNSRQGSEQNIYAHYDLGNEFFQLFLDESLTYSCAIWDGCESLHAAQQAKFADVCDRLSLKSDDRVLEIGCGWGGFAMYAAQEIGCHVTGITVSRAQYELACQRVKKAGLGGRIDICLMDYRDVVGRRFDKVVSIEMFEAVGREYWGVFFDACASVLRPGGKMFLQTIGIPDHLRSDRMRASGWISKYIFPGGVLPALIEIRETVRGRGHALVVSAVREIGPHYVQTLNEWRKAFWRAETKVRAQGFDDKFIRMWDFYLSSCEAAFKLRMVRDVQVVMEKSVDDARQLS